jgi:hypothetical protein
VITVFLELCYFAGKSNDWTNWFTVAQDEQFVEFYKKEMAGYDVDF